MSVKLGSCRLLNWFSRRALYKTSFFLLSQLAGEGVPRFLPRFGTQSPVVSKMKSTAAEQRCWMWYQTLLLLLLL